MENTQLALKTLNAHSEPRELNPLQKTIVSMVKAMRSDYGAVYKNTFSTAEELQLYKQRLYAKLKDLPLDCIFEGYETCVANNTKFCPTVPEIVGATLAAVKRKAKEDAKAAELKKLAALPPPKIRQAAPGEIMGMLKQAMTTPTDGEEARQARLRKAERELNALVKKDTERGVVRKGPDWAAHACARCSKPGTLSSSNTGGGNFYCSDHYDMTV